MSIKNNTIIVTVYQYRWAVAVVIFVLMAFRHRQADIFLFSIPELPTCSKVRIRSRLFKTPLTWMSRCCFN